MIALVLVSMVLTPALWLLLTQALERVQKVTMAVILVVMAVGSSLSYSENLFDLQTESTLLFAGGCTRVRISHCLLRRHTK